MSNMVTDAGRWLFVTAASSLAESTPPQRTEGRSLHIIRLTWPWLCVMSDGLDISPPSSPDDRCPRNPKSLTVGQKHPWLQVKTYCSAPWKSDNPVSPHKKGTRATSSCLWIGPTIKSESIIRLQNSHRSYQASLARALPFGQTNHPILVTETAQKCHRGWRWRNSFRLLRQNSWRMMQSMLSKCESGNWQRIYHKLNWRGVWSQ